MVRTRAPTSRCSKLSASLGASTISLATILLIGTASIVPLAFRAPCLMLITMRGQWGEFNPWQVPMGQAAKPTLEAMGVKCFPVDKGEEVGETFAAAADLAFNSRTSAAVLVSQRIVGAKGFGQK